MNPTRIHEDSGSIPGLAQCVKALAAVIYGIGRRCGSDPKLLWLWYRQAAAALIRPLGWELPYAASAALKSKKKFFEKWGFIIAGSHGQFLIKKWHNLYKVND